MRLTWRMAGVLAAVAVVGGGTGAALAAPGGPFGGGDGDGAGDLAAAINERAGTSITAADVEAALEQLRAERLAAEVAAGRLTHEQADQITAHEAFREKAHTAIEKAIADAVGVSADQLEQAREAGTSPADLAREKGVERRAVVVAVTAALEALKADAPEGLREPPGNETLAQRAARIVDGAKRRHVVIAGPQGRPGGPFAGPGGPSAATVPAGRGV